MYNMCEKEEREERRRGEERTGCIQNENPHTEEWWESRILEVLGADPPRGLAENELKLSLSTE